MKTINKPDNAIKRRGQVVARGLEKLDIPLRPSNSAWTHEEVIAEWRLAGANTSFWQVQEALADEQIASALATECLPAEVAQILLQNWVEMVHQQLYREIRNDESHELYTSVLYLSLNPEFLPAKNVPLQLAYRAEQELARTTLFLDRFREWAGQNEGRHPLASLGWLVSRSGKPDLVMSWDDLIPHVHYQQYWSEGRPGEVVKLKNGKLTIRVTPKVGKPHEVTYTPRNHEAEGLEPRDRVRYWENLNGNSFLLPEAPFSPYVLTKKKVWDRMDEYAYKLDPVPIG